MGTETMSDRKIRWAQYRAYAIADFEGRRLYVKRASKGSRSWVGSIDGQQVAVQDNQDATMRDVAKAALSMQPRATKP